MLFPAESAGFSSMYSTLNAWINPTVVHQKPFQIVSLTYFLFTLTASCWQSALLKANILYVSQFQRMSLVSRLCVRQSSGQSVAVKKGGGRRRRERAVCFRASGKLSRRICHRSMHLLGPERPPRNFFDKKTRPASFRERERTSLLIRGGDGGFFGVSLLVFSSESEVGSISHHGEMAPPSDAVWKEEDLEGGVHVHSEAVTNSSSDLLSLDVFGVFCCAGLRLEYHSCRERMITVAESEVAPPVPGLTSGVVDAVPSRIFLMFGVTAAPAEDGPSICALHRASSSCSASPVTSDSFSEIASTDDMWLSSTDLKRQYLSPIFWVRGTHYVIIRMAATVAPVLCHSRGLQLFWRLRKDPTNLYYPVLHPFSDFNHTRRFQRNVNHCDQQGDGND